MHFGALTVQINGIRIIGLMDWIGFRKLDPRPTLKQIVIRVFSEFGCCQDARTAQFRALKTSGCLIPPLVFLAFCYANTVGNGLPKISILGITTKAPSDLDKIYDTAIST